MKIFTGSMEGSRGRWYSGIVVARADVSTHERGLGLVVGADGPLGAPVDRVLHAQILKRGLRRSEHAAEHGTVDVGVLRACRGRRV
eukprot:5929601-Karenia_brevis.AAC.1